MSVFKFGCPNSVVFSLSKTHLTRWSIEPLNNTQTLQYDVDLMEILTKAVLNDQKVTDLIHTSPQ